jgi:hypothetical protein
MHAEEGSWMSAGSGIFDHVCPPSSLRMMVP